MVGPTETIASGAPRICPGCKVRVKDKVYYSPAGWYIGTLCKCGPYSRESYYYGSRRKAETALESGDYGR